MRIQCPKCRQRFDAPDELMGKTVECGSCEHQFKVSDDVVVAEKTKAYPGEKTSSAISEFEEFSEFKNIAEPIEASKGFSQAHYSDNVNIAKLEPLKPQQILAILLGLGIFILVGASFLLAGREGGAMSDIGVLNRYILVGFSALLAGALLIYGMRKNRQLGIILALILGGGLVSLPYFLPGDSVVESSSYFEGKEVSLDGEGSILKDEDDIKREYLLEIGYSPIEQALEIHPESEVIGVFFRGVNNLLSSKIATSIYEATDKLDHGILYERYENSLLLLTKQKLSIQELAVICGEFGEVTKVSEELRIIDLTVEEGDIDKATSKAAFKVSDISFFKENLSALKNMSSVERLGAVRRLGSAEPAAYRNDIVAELLKQLPDSDVETQLAIVKTLKTWSKPGEGAEEAVLSAAEAIYETGDLDLTTVEFLIERDVDGGEVILMNLWEKDPVVWSELFIKLGANAEKLLLPKISNMNSIQFSSACRILKKVGTFNCLSTLTSVLDTVDGQNEKTLKATIDEIKKRL
ncbi:zinc-ribbon domain-containing protein [Akkermansiaceae bacterium]|nr:zinc-ribbon domain-containing protein [Akkermansiaceae bacterium]